MAKMKFIVVRVGEKADLKNVGYLHEENDIRALYDRARNGGWVTGKTVGFIHDGELVAEFRKVGQNYKLVYVDPLKIRNVKNGKIVW